MVTLQDLKNVVQALEEELLTKTKFKADELPIKLDFLTDVKSIELSLDDYLGDMYITINLQ